MTQPISIAMTLRKAARCPDGIEKVKAAALTMGLKPSSEGGATICFRVSQEDFRRLFGNALKSVEESTASSSDHGTPAGFVAEELPITASLREWVEQIAVLPPAIRMHGAL